MFYALLTYSLEFSCLPIAGLPSCSVFPFQVIEAVWLSISFVHQRQMALSREIKIFGILNQVLHIGVSGAEGKHMVRVKL